MTVLPSKSLLLSLMLAAGCTATGPVAPPDDAARPRARPDAAPPPPAAARTAEQFDTTSAAEREAAGGSAQPPAGDVELGRTIASLGDPSEPGFWAKTPLVKAVTPGRLVYPETGKSVLVELRPLAGDPGGGSQVSLPALRLLGVPLTALPELLVFARAP